MKSRDTVLLGSVPAENWQTEMTGFYTYQSLANAESDPQRRNLFRGLAAAERHHATLWSSRYQELQAGPLVYRGDEHGEAAKVSAVLVGSAADSRLLETEEAGSPDHC